VPEHPSRHILHAPVRIHSEGLGLQYRTLKVWAGPYSCFLYLPFTIDPSLATEHILACYLHQDLRSPKRNVVRFFCFRAVSSFHTARSCPSARYIRPAGRQRPCSCSFLGSFSHTCKPGSYSLSLSDTHTVFLSFPSRDLDIGERATFVCQPASNHHGYDFALRPRVLHFLLYCTCTCSRMSDTCMQTRLRPPAATALLHRKLTFVTPSLFRAPRFQA
jgi:hypothetical protein